MSLSFTGQPAISYNSVVVIARLKHTIYLLYLTRVNGSPLDFLLSIILIAQFLMLPLALMRLRMGFLLVLDGMAFFSGIARNVMIYNGRLAFPARL